MLSPRAAERERRRLAREAELAKLDAEAEKRRKERERRRKEREAQREREAQEGATPAFCSIAATRSALICATRLCVRLCVFGNALLAERACARQATLRVESKNFDRALISPFYFCVFARGGLCVRAAARSGRFARCRIGGN